MENKIKHNLNESYLQSLTDEQRDKEMREWNYQECKQYLCPNGTMTLEEFRKEVYDAVDKMILEKYGSDYID